MILASYSTGSRQRLAGLLADHGLDRTTLVDGWQEAQGVAATGRVALAVLPLDHGFRAPSVAVVTEQDLLGDRLVRRARRRKSADAFLSELATLSPGDLVVHRDHGIGRYDGLTQIPVQKAPHDCVALTYAGGDKLYVPVKTWMCCRATDRKATAFRSIGWAAKPGSAARAGCANGFAKLRAN